MIHQSQASSSLVSNLELTGRSKSAIVFHVCLREWERIKNHAWPRVEMNYVLEYSYGPWKKKNYRVFSELCQ